MNGISSKFRRERLSFRDSMPSHASDICDAVLLLSVQRFCPSVVYSIDKHSVIVACMLILHNAITSLLSDAAFCHYIQPVSQ